MHARDGAGHRIVAGQGGEVVVLDHNKVVESAPMVAGAAALHRIFFKRPPAGSGFSCVENEDARAVYGFDITRRLRGDSGKSLEIIQRRPLGGEQRAAGAVDFQQGFARPRLVAVLELVLKNGITGKLPERLFRQSQTAHRERFARDDNCTSRRLGGQ